ncbi:50S ribosomal protein L19 [Patescibacteria group bacterium]|nr:50S ribosomal protein L19 [Patescibacteria group bacterium]
MPDLVQEIAAKYVKPKFTDVKVGDTVRVYTTVKEGSKTRSQFFEGLVIRRRAGVGPDATFTVRRIASGVGVERVFPLHSPIITDVQVIRGAKVRRAQLHYMRERSGKSARLKEQPVKKGERDVLHPWLNDTAAAPAPSKAAPAASQSKETPAAKPAPKAETKKPEAKTEDAKQPAKPEAKTDVRSQMSDVSKKSKDAKPEEK